MKLMGPEPSNTGLIALIKEISESDFIIFIDDFHYIPQQFRDEIGKQIKIAADKGVKILTASVPHRTDDVVRSNPELRGRVAAIDFGRWDSNHLAEIAIRGFRELNVDLATPIVTRLTGEALGSPQLMQTICYHLCSVLGLDEKLPEHKRLDIDDHQIKKALLSTSQFTDFSKILSALHAGPRTRGTERKFHKLIDNSSGDVYRTVLLALKQQPVSLSFTYDEILSRVRSVCYDNDIPAGSSITSCLEQMQTIAESIQPTSVILAWDGDNLDIVDPYFAFFLRCSEKLNSLSDRDKTS
jgi:hypothetical protein